MPLGFLGFFSIISPVHGKNRVNKRAVDCDKLAEGLKVSRKRCAGLLREFIENMLKLLNPSIIDSF